MTPTEFLSLGHTSWLEFHWTVPFNAERVKKFFSDMGKEIEIYRMCYPTVKSDGFFAHWVVVTAKDKS